MGRTRHGRRRGSPGPGVRGFLRARYTDLLYSLKVGGQDARIYVLFEQQSSGERWMALRLLRYMMAIWDSCIADGATVLPVVIPVVLHPGDRGWTAATRFEDLFELPPGAAEFTPHFRFALDDLGAGGEAALHARAASAYTRLVLSAQGRQEGRQEGRSELLLRLLRRRFGELPAAVGERIAAAQLSELDRWAEQLLVAGCLDEIFRKP